MLALLAALGDDVGGTEFTAQIRTVGVPAHQNDLLGSEALRGEHTAEPDGAVTDDGDGVARPDPGCHRAVMAGAEHVGQCEQRRHQCRVRRDREFHQRALGQRHPHSLALARVQAWCAPAATVAARCVQTLSAEVTRVVRPDERSNDQIAGSETADVRSDLFDDADELVAHAAALLLEGHRPIGPQVAAADAGRSDADDGVGGFVEDRVGHGLDAHVSGLVHDGCSHGHQSTSVSCGLAVSVVPGNGSTPLAGRGAPTVKA